MAKKTKFLDFKKVDKAYEIKLQCTQFTKEVEDEVYSVIGLLFFQTTSHIQLDVTNLKYLPLSFITQITNLGKDLRAKNRILSLTGIPYSSYHFFERFKMTRLFHQGKAGLIKKKP